ncbi:MAG: hypothetical protein ACX93T_00010 [Bacteroidota bacterium]
MRYFECLVAETSGYMLRIVEDIPELGFDLIVENKQNRLEYIPVTGSEMLQECKEMAAEKYGVPMDAWRSEGEYFESLVAVDSKGNTLRIREDLPGVGFYLYCFDKDSIFVRNYLQDTLQACKEEALEIYGVPMDAWQEEKVQ